MQPSQTFISPDHMTTNECSHFHKTSSPNYTRTKNPNGTSKGFLHSHAIVFSEIKKTYPIDFHPHLRHFTVLTSAHATQKKRSELTFSVEFFLFKELHEYRVEGVNGKVRKERKRVGFPVQEIVLCHILIGRGGFIGILQQPVKIRLFSASEVCCLAT